MGFIHDRRLVFSDRGIIKSLIAHLATTGEPVSVRAKELPEGANHVGIGIPGISETTSVDDPWQTFVRSLAYDHVMARLCRAA